MPTIWSYKQTPMTDIHTAGAPFTRKKYTGKHRKKITHKQGSINTRSLKLAPRCRYVLSTIFIILKWLATGWTSSHYLNKTIFSPRYVLSSPDTLNNLQISFQQRMIQHFPSGDPRWCYWYSVAPTVITRWFFSDVLYIHRWCVISKWLWTGPCYNDTRLCSQS